MSQSRPSRLTHSQTSTVHRDWPSEERSNDHADRINAAWIAIQEPLIAFLSRRLKSKEDARDAAQDTYLRLLSVADSSAIRDLHGLAFHFAKNIANDRQRARATRERLARSLLADQQSLQALDEQPSTEHVCAVQDELKAIMLAFDKLPAKSKHIFAADLQGEPISSVAARLGIQPRAVHRQVGRLRERLRQVLSRPRRV